MHAKIIEQNCGNRQILWWLHSGSYRSDNREFPSWARKIKTQWKNKPKPISLMIAYMKMLKSNKINKCWKYHIKEIAFFCTIWICFLPYLNLNCVLFCQNNLLFLLRSDISLYTDNSYVFLYLKQTWAYFLLSWRSRALKSGKLATSR